MIHDIFRSIFGVLALVTVSGCAVETSTVDVSIADEEGERSSSAAAPERHDGHDGRAIEARPSTLLVPHAEPPNSACEREPNGPYPVPWSARPD